jgi:hypothetical protein
MEKASILCLCAATACLIAAGTSLAAESTQTKRAQPSATRAAAVSGQNDTAVLAAWDEAEQGFAVRLARLSELKVEAARSNNARQVEEIDSLVRRLGEQRLMRHRLTHEQLSPAGREALAKWMAVKQMGEQTPSAMRVRDEMNSRADAAREREELAIAAAANRPAHLSPTTPTRAHMLSRGRDGANGDAVFMRACVNNDFTKAEPDQKVITASERIEAHRAALKSSGHTQHVGPAHAEPPAGPRPKLASGLARTAGKEPHPGASPATAANTASDPSATRTSREQDLREELEQLDEDLAALERKAAEKQQSGSPDS